MSADKWTFRHDAVMELFDLISPAGRRVGEIDLESDAKSLVDLLNVGLEARRNQGDFFPEWKNTGVFIRAKNHAGKWASLDIADPELSDEQLYQWLMDKAQSPTKFSFFIALVAVLLKRPGLHKMVQP